MTQQDITTLTEIITSTQNHLSEQVMDFKSQVDTRLFAIESRMATKEDLAQYVTRDEFDGLRVTLDKILANTELNSHERVALAAQVTRHEDWIIEAAPVIGVEYTPGA